MPVNGVNGASHFPEFVRGVPAWIESKATPRPTVAQAGGIRFESRAHAWLALKLWKSPHQLYVANPWIEHKRPQQSRFLQPDALFFDFALGIITVIEVKRRFTPKAWEQLHNVYRPFLLTMFPARLWELRFLNVCEVVDPGATRRPFALGTSFDECALAYPQIGVYNLDLRMERLTASENE